MLAILKREFKSYFTSPIGYVCLAVFVAFEGFYFSMLYSAGYPDVSFVYSGMFTIALFIIPILTMRLLSEDKRQKVDQALLTAPVSLWSIAVGKFLAALSVFTLGFSPTLIYQLILQAVSTPDWLVFFGNYLGIILLGASLISLGLFISSLTESQVVSAVGSFAVSLAILSLDSLSSVANSEFIDKIVGWVSFSARYSAFVSGTFDFTNLIFFISFTVVFLFLTVRMLEKKRYS